MGDCRAKPDEWKQRVWQPVLPTKIIVDLPVVAAKVQPDVEKLVDAKTWKVVDLKPVRFECLARYVVIAFKWRDRPAALPIGDKFIGSSMKNSHFATSFAVWSRSGQRQISSVVYALITSITLSSLR